MIDVKKLGEILHAVSELVEEDSLLSLVRNDYEERRESLEAARDLVIRHVKARDKTLADLTRTLEGAGIEPDSFIREHVVGKFVSLD